MWQPTPVSELRFTGRSHDGEYLEFADDIGNSFQVRITDVLKNSIIDRRLSAVRDEAATFSVKEIQARLRAGETFEEVSRATGLPLEKIERYASPILQERAWIIEQAEKSTPKGSALNLHDLVISRLAPRGVNMNQVSWNTWRLENGSWHLVLTYPASEGSRQAVWIFDANIRTLLASDEGAKWICGEEPTKHPSKSEPSPEHGVLFPAEGETPAPPRLVAVRTDKTTPEEIPVDAKQDGVTRRISIPSWDDIMFGRSKKKEETEN
ncbi:MAG: hypothetical protein RLY74_486 [Actinomycetota bacterium]